MNTVWNLAVEISYLSNSFPNKQEKENSHMLPIISSVFLYRASHAVYVLWSDKEVENSAFHHKLYSKKILNYFYNNNICPRRKERKRRSFKECRMKNLFLDNSLRLADIEGMFRKYPLMGSNVTRTLFP